MSKEITLLRVYYSIMRGLEKDLPGVTASERLIFAIRMVQKQTAIIF